MDNDMTESEEHIGLLFTAELQFRLASAVRLATALGTQPIDLPVSWAHGDHSVQCGDIALRPDQADYAAHFLQRSATYLLAVAVKDAIRAVVRDPKASAESEVRAACQIARLIRNPFAHSPFSPIWSIDPNCQSTTFEITDVIRLDTTDLHGKAFDWRHYGGPLALYQLAQFTRIKVLKDDPPPRKVLPIPKTVVYQQGNLILRKWTKFLQVPYLLMSSRWRMGAFLWGTDTSSFPRIGSSCELFRRSGRSPNFFEFGLQMDSA